MGKNQECIKEYLDQVGADSARGIATATGLTIEQVSDVLYHNYVKHQKFYIGFSTARKLGQCRVFGRTIGKYIYYVHRRELLNWLVNNFKSPRLDATKTILRSKGLLNNEIDYVVEKQLLKNKKAVVLGDL